MTTTNNSKKDLSSIMKEIDASVNKNKQDGIATDSYVEPVGDKDGHLIVAFHTGMMMKRQEQGLFLEQGKKQFLPEQMPLNFQTLLQYAYYPIAEQTKGQAETIGRIQHHLATGDIVYDPNNGVMRFSDNVTQKARSGIEVKISNVVKFAIQNAIYKIDIANGVACWFLKKGFPKQYSDSYIGIIGTQNDDLNNLSLSAVKTDTKAYKDAKNKGFIIMFGSAIAKATNSMRNPDGSFLIDPTSWFKEHPSEARGVMGVNSNQNQGAPSMNIFKRTDGGNVVQQDGISHITYSVYLTNSDGLNAVFLSGKDVADDVCKFFTTDKWELANPNKSTLFAYFDGVSLPGQSIQITNKVTKKSGEFFVPDCSNGIDPKVAKNLSKKNYSVLYDLMKNIMPIVSKFDTEPIKKEAEKILEDAKGWIETFSVKEIRATDGMKDKNPYTANTIVMGDIVFKMHDGKEIDAPNIIGRGETVNRASDAFLENVQSLVLGYKPNNFATKVVARKNAEKFLSIVEKYGFAQNKNQRYISKTAIEFAERVELGRIMGVSMTRYFETNDNTIVSVRYDFLIPNEFQASFTIEGADGEDEINESSLSLEELDAILKKWSEKRNGGKKSVRRVKSLEEFL